MRKKSQMAIFFLVGLVVLASFGIIYLATSNVRKASPSTATGSEGDSLQAYVQSCLDLTSKNAVWLAGRYGGYVYPTYPPVMQTDYGIVVYDYQYGENMKMLPSIEDIEQQISIYVASEIPNCINFRQFREQGYSVSAGFPIAKTTIAQNNVIVDLDYPITLSKGAEQLKQENFKSTVNVHLRSVYDNVSNIISAVGDADSEGDFALIGEVSKDLQNQPKFSINFLFRIPESDMKVDYKFMPDHISTLWAIHDDKTKPEYLFIFATKHRQVID
jgi:hypothetical protein